MKLIIFSLFFILTATIFWPILVQDKAIINDFTLYHTYPLMGFVGDFFSQHNSLPPWLPDILGGFPYWVGQFLPISHFLLFAKFLAPLTAWSWTVFFGFVTSGLACFLLARSLGLSRLAAAVAATIYTFSQLNLWLGTIPAFNISLPFLPLLFWLVLKLSRRERVIVYWLAVTVLTGLGWYAVFSEYWVLTLFAVAGFALWLDYRRVGWTWSALLVGTLAGAFKLLPTANFFSYSVRAEGALGATAFFQWGDLINYFFPYFNFSYSGFLPALSTSFYLYVGVTALVLLLVALVEWRSVVSQARPAVYFLILFGLAFLMLFPFSHLYTLVRKITFGVSGGAWKAMFLGNFSLALLAGYALDRIELARAKRYWRVITAGLAYGATSLLVLALSVRPAWHLFHTFWLDLAMRYFERHVYSTIASHPLDYYRGQIDIFLEEFTGHFSLADYHFVLSLVFILLPIWLLYFYCRQRLTIQRFRQLLLGLVIANVVLLWQGFYPLAPHSAIIQPPATVEFLRSTGQTDFRVFRFWPGLAAYGPLGLDDRDEQTKLALNRALLTPNLNVLYGVASIEGDENFMSQRQARLMAQLGSFRSPQNDASNWSKLPLTLEEKLARFQAPTNRRLLSMLNVRYIFSSFAFDLPWRKVFETKVTSANLPVYVYENPNVLPRVYLADNMKFIASDQAVALQELLAVENFKQTTLIECTLAECQDAPYQSDVHDQLLIQDLHNGYLRLHTSLRHPRWLVFSESNLPTWEVRITNNLEPKTYNLVPIYTANYLFQAVYLPAGENEVEFAYGGILKQSGYSLLHLLQQFYEKY